MKKKMSAFSNCFDAAIELENTLYVSQNTQTHTLTDLECVCFMLDITQKREKLFGTNKKSQVAADSV